LRAFDGKTGKPRWSFDPKAGPTQPDYSLASASFCVADLAGDGRRAICLAVRDRKSEAILLDADGQVIDRRDIYATAIAAADMDGDGREELLLTGYDTLRATRGGLEQLVWEKPHNTRARQLEIQAAAKGQPATVAYAVGDASDTTIHLNGVPHIYLGGDAIYGLDGATGRTTWRGMYDIDSEIDIGPLKAGRDGELPLVLSRPLERNVSIARYVLATGISGQYPATFARQNKANAGEPDSASLARSLAADPRFARALPWTDLKVPLRDVALHVLFDSLFVCFIPGWLIVRVIDKGSWSMRGMFVLTAAVAIAIGSYLLLPGPPFGSPQAARIVAMLACTPFIAFFYFLVTWGVQRRWRRVGGLLAAAALAAIIFAVVALALDAGSKPAVQHYALRGWWTIVVPAAWLGGVLTYAAIILARLARAVVRRFRPQT
jgi:hypothetical protein